MSAMMIPVNSVVVIPAKAEIQCRCSRRWVPAFAGTTSASYKSACCQCAFRGFYHTFRARQVFHLEAEQRDMRVVTGDAFDRRDQVVHPFLSEACGDFRAEARGLGRFVHDHATA